MTNPLSPYFRLTPKRKPARWFACYPDGSRVEINKKTRGGYEYAPGKFAEPLSYARERALEEGATLEKVTT